MMNFLARGAAALCVLMSATATSAATSGDGAETTYLAQCAACHGVHLGGAYGPPLSGKAFVDKWQGQGAAAMRDLIVASMPPAKPGSLDLASATGLTNFIARHNRMAGLDDVAAARPVAAASSEGGAASGGAGDPGRNEDAAYRAAKAARTALLAGMTPVTEAMLRQPRDEDWLNWRRTDDGHGFSPLTQINSANARKLRLAFSLSLTAGTNQITPLVHDGVMFVDSNGAVLAIDARNGDILWKFNRVAAPVTPAGPPTTQPRNLALFGTTLYVPTLDNHMLALDARSGKLLWDHTIEGSDGVLRLTGGPMVVHGKVIQGVSGCSGAGHAGGCFILALDAASGKELWRFNTIARPGEAGGDSWNGAPLDKRFGGSVWVAGTYDATLNLVYFGTGQTYHITPLMKGDGASEASNDALYTDTTLALNPDTGQLVWHYQHHAREVWDLDWAFERTVLTLPLPGGPTRVVVTMGKLGILDALDARTGRYLFSHDMGLQNLVTGIDARTGPQDHRPGAGAGSGQAQDRVSLPRRRAQLAVDRLRRTQPHALHPDVRIVHELFVEAQRRVGHPVHGAAAPRQRWQVRPRGGAQSRHAQAELAAASPRFTGQRRTGHRRRPAVRGFTRPLFPRLRQRQRQALVADASRSHAQRLSHHLCTRRPPVRRHHQRWRRAGGRVVAEPDAGNREPRRCDHAVGVRAGRGRRPALGPCAAPAATLVQEVNRRARARRGRGRYRRRP